MTYQLLSCSTWCLDEISVDVVVNVSEFLSSVDVEMASDVDVRIIMIKS